jgi:hypothetical protein
MESRRVIASVMEQEEREPIEQPSISAIGQYRCIVQAPSFHEIAFLSRPMSRFRLRSPECLRKTVTGESLRLLYKSRIVGTRLSNLFRTGTLLVLSQ